MCLAGLPVLRELRYLNERAANAKEKQRAAEWFCPNTLKNNEVCFYEVDLRSNNPE